MKRIQPITLQPSSTSLEITSTVSETNIQLRAGELFKNDQYPILSGLECLQQLDAVFLEQLTQREEGEILPGIELDNQYVMKNIYGQRILSASENTNFCFRFCFGSARPFEINLYNYTGDRVLSVERSMSLGLCCVCGICCGNKVQVIHSSGESLGYVKHVLCTIRPTFKICDVNGKVIFIIRGPKSCCFVCCKVNFKIFTPDDNQTEIGRITKHWGGILKETFTDVDTFGIKFPRSLRVDLKALLIASAFIIDFTHFETHG